MHLLAQLKVALRGALPTPAAAVRLWLAAAWRGDDGALAAPVVSEPVPVSARGQRGTVAATLSLPVPLPGADGTLYLLVWLGAGPASAQRAELGRRLDRLAVALGPPGDPALPPPPSLGALLRGEGAMAPGLDALVADPEGLAQAPTDAGPAVPAALVGLLGSQLSPGVVAALSGGALFAPAATLAPLGAPAETGEGLRAVAPTAALRGAVDVLLAAPPEADTVQSLASALVPVAVRGGAAVQPREKRPLGQGRLRGSALLVLGAAAAPPAPPHAAVPVFPDPAAQGDDDAVVLLRKSADGTELLQAALGDKARPLATLPGGFAPVGLLRQGRQLWAVGVAKNRPALALVLPKNDDKVIVLESAELRADDLSLWVPGPADRAKGAWLAAADGEGGLSVHELLGEKAVRRLHEPRAKVVGAPALWRDAQGAHRLLAVRSGGGLLAGRAADGRRWALEKVSDALPRATSAPCALRWVDRNHHLFWRGPAGELVEVWEGGRGHQSVMLGEKLGIGAIVGAPRGVVGPDGALHLLVRSAAKGWLSLSLRDGGRWQVVALGLSAKGPAPLLVPWRAKTTTALVAPTAAGGWSLFLADPRAAAWSPAGALA